MYSQGNSEDQQCSTMFNGNVTVQYLILPTISYREIFGGLHDEVSTIIKSVLC